MTDAEFLGWLEGEAAWYRKASARWNTTLMACRLAPVIISLLLAIFITPELFNSIGRWLIVIASALTAFGNDLLYRLKVSEMEELREYGNIEASRLVVYARQKLDQFANNPQQLNAVQDEVRALMHKLDLDQHRKHVEIDRK